MHEDEETLDVTAMVTRIDLLENTMHLILNEMHELTVVHVTEKGKNVVANPSEDMPMHDQGEPETSSHVPNVGRVRWQLKDLKPPKYNGNTAAWTADAAEQWLSKWEQCFRLCNIVDDAAKIQQATYNLLDVAHRWWRKIEQDKAEPTTWRVFKVICYNNFVPPDERSRALDAWFFMSQNHYLVQDYADKYREILLKVPEHIPDFLQVHKFVLGLKETLKPLVRKEECPTLDKAIELAIVLEDSKKFTTGYGQKSSWTRALRPSTQGVAALPSMSESRGKESRELHMIKTSKGKRGSSESSLLQEIKEVQKEDPFAQPVRSRLESDLIVSDESALSASSSRRTASPFAKFSVENGWIKRKGKIYVPSAQELRTKITMIVRVRAILEDNSLRPKKKGGVTPATIGSSTCKKKDSIESEKLDPDFEFGDKYGRIQPEYDIIYKQDVSPNDVYLQMSEKDPSSLSCDIMIMRVKLPQTECALDIQLDVKATYMKLTTNLYFLVLYLPQKVKHEKSTAKWEVDKETLVITMPIDREPFL
ncbi:hypothetical protein L7F22_059416 [Adiantum nelumboides]|nr:hypothetical protein [Adiantum nelumboides]